MTAQQIGVSAVLAVVSFFGTAWVWSIRTWRRRNRDWRNGRLS